MQRIQLSILTLGFLWTVIGGGCSGSSAPSASDAKTIVERQIQKQSKGIIKLVKFDKANAQTGQVMGVTVYSLEYRATIKFTEDCWWGGPFGEVTPFYWTRFLHFLASFSTRQSVESLGAK